MGPGSHPISAFIGGPFPCLSLSFPISEMGLPPHGLLGMRESGRRVTVSSHCFLFPAQSLIQTLWDSDSHLKGPLVAGFPSPTADRPPTPDPAAQPQPGSQPEWVLGSSLRFPGALGTLLAGPPLPAHLSRQERKGLPAGACSVLSRAGAPARPGPGPQLLPLAVLQWGRRTTCRPRGSTRTATTSSRTSGRWAVCCTRWASAGLRGPGGRPRGLPGRAERRWEAGLRGAWLARG